MTFEEAMIGWIRRHGWVPSDTVEIRFDRIERCDGWTSEDSGTSWPAETRVHYSVKRDGPRAKFRRLEVSAPEDVGDFLREILEGDEHVQPS